MSQSSQTYGFEVIAHTVIEGLDTKGGPSGLSLRATFDTPIFDAKLPIDPALEMSLLMARASMRVVKAQAVLYLEGSNDRIIEGSAPIGPDDIDEDLVSAILDESSLEWSGPGDLQKISVPDDSGRFAYVKDSLIGPDRDVSVTCHLSMGIT